MAMTAQEYLDTFNAAINSGAYEEAARVLRQAEGNFGPGVYDVAGVVLEANPNLPPEIDYMSPQGIQSIRDYVASVPAPVTAASPALNLINTLPNTGLIPSGNVSGTGAGVVSSGPPVGSLQNPAVQSLISLTSAGIAAPAPPAVDPVAQKYVDDFNALINQGNYDGAARLVKEAELAGYGDEAYRAAAVALDANTNLPPGIDFISSQGIQSIRDYVNTATAPPPAPVDPNVERFNSLIRTGNFKEAGELATSSGFTPEQVLTYLNDPNIFPEFGGNVTLDTVKSFVPKPPAAPLSFTDQLNALFQTNLGRLPTEREAEIYAKDFGGTFSPELEAAFLSRSAEEMGNRQKSITETADAAAKTEKEAADTAANAAGLPGVDQILGIPKFERQAQSNVPFAPLRRGLAQLRPAMYMPGLTSGQAPLGGSGFTPESLRTANQGLSLADRAYQMDVGGVSPAELSAAIGTPVGQLQAEYNQSRPIGLFSTAAPTSRGLPEDFVLQTGAYGAPTPTFLALPEKKTATSAAETPLPSGSIQGTDYTQNLIIGYTDVGTPIYAPTAPEATAKEGGLIKMAEGGAPPKMAELSAKEAGSTFDISKYIDDQGRLVGGMSKPIRDAYGKIIGYESGDLPLPIQRDVVFGRELREKEAAMRLTDAEREQMMVEMAMRQGRTGISPTRGGLAGIEIGDPMMRNRPQYYSTVEQFRPRYAEGGLASVAQNLADKGRKGDSMLVHMTPDEVAGLQALAQQMGGSLTINPQTGLPEANFFKKLLPMALGFALGPAGAGLFQSALTAGLAVGAGYTLATGSLQQGISAGLGAYGGSNLGTGLQAAGTADAVGQAAASEAANTAATDVAAAAGGDAASTAMVDISALPPGSEAQFLAARPEFGQATSDALGGRSFGSFATELPETVLAPGMGDPSSMSALELAETAPTAANTAYIPPAPTAPRTPGSAFTGLERSLSGDKATRDLAAADYAAETGSTLGTSAMQIAGGAAGQSAADAERAMKAEQAAIVAKQDERKRRFDALFGRTVGTLPARSGGLMKLAGGGMTYMEAGGTTGPTGTPRDVTGTGDGMSDSVPASIEGVQEARLADGEFVIPADVVADIGNGSSDAGSKKLYDMMDRIRKARHGTTEQPPEIQAERLMPA